ncbi:MAG: fibronectin type III domain-containing protein [Bacteroidota bacterium]
MRTKVYSSILVSIFFSCFLVRSQNSFVDMSSDGGGDTYVLEDVDAYPEDARDMMVPLPAREGIDSYPFPMASVLWQEDFTGLANGATSDNGATAWSSTINQGTFEVQAGLFFLQGVNTGSNATWTSEEIDIGNYTNINISYLVGDAGDGEKETSDYVRGYYVLNNGSRIMFSEVTDDVPTPLLQSVGGLTGNSLRIEIDFQVSYGNETYNIDDITIEGDVLNSGDSDPPTTPVVNSSALTDTSVDLSWSASDNVAVTAYRLFNGVTEISGIGNSTAYVVSGLTHSTSYTFSVRAYDAENNESNPGTLTITTNAPPSGGGAAVWDQTGSDIHYNTGNVGIGTSTLPTGYRLAVDGKMIGEEVKVQLSAQWPDYVFGKGYDLPTLESIAKYIKEEGHLPKMPSARDAEANGIDLGEMNRLLLEKIEELTLHIIALQKRIDTIKANR